MSAQTPGSIVKANLKRPVIRLRKLLHNLIKWLDKHYFFAQFVGAFFLLFAAVSVYFTFSPPNPPGWLCPKWSLLWSNICRIVCLFFGGGSFFLAYHLHARWSYCHLCKTIDSTKIERIRTTEMVSKIVRFLFYGAAIFLVVNANWLHFGLTAGLRDILSWIGLSPNTDAIKATGLLIVSLVLFFVRFDTLSRQTFRKWPVYFLSASTVCLFLVFMDLPYKDSGLTWGLMDTAHIAKSLGDDIPGLFKNSILAAAAVSLVYFLLKDRWDKFQKKLTTDTVKETRRQLLSHWGFKPIYQLSNDALNRIIIFFLAICLVAGLAVFVEIPDKQGDSTATNPSDAVTATDNTANLIDTNGESGFSDDNRLAVGRNDGIISIGNDLVILSESAKSDNKVDEDNVDISFTGYLYILAVVLGAIGIAAHFEISNKSLIESEYYYLLYHSLDQSWDEPQDGINELRRADYFQVMSYLYSNGSTLKSEEHEWHKLSTVIKELYERSASKSQCGRTVFFSRMLYSYAEIKEQISLNTSIKGSGVDLPEKLRSQIVPIPEMLFCKEITSLLDSYSNSEDSPFIFLRKLRDCYFGLANTGALYKVWQQRLAAQNIPSDSFIQAIQTDAFVQFARHQSNDDCLLSWMCGENSCIHGFTCKTDPTYTNRRLLAAEYPFLINFCATQRVKNWEINLEEIGKYVINFLSNSSTRKEITAPDSLLGMNLDEECLALIIPLCCFFEENFAEMFSEGKEAARYIDALYDDESSFQPFKTWDLRCKAHFRSSLYFIEPASTNPVSHKRLIGRYSTLLVYWLFIKNP